jgi:hypothetical protein
VAPLVALAVVLWLVALRTIRVRPAA